MSEADERTDMCDPKPSSDAKTDRNRRGDFKVTPLARRSESSDADEQDIVTEVSVSDDGLNDAPIRGLRAIFEDANGRMIEVTGDVDDVIKAVLAIKA